MHSIGLEGDTVSLVMSGFINVMQLVAVLPAFFLLDSVGRKPLLKGGALVMALSHLAVALLVTATYYVAPIISPMIRSYGEAVTGTHTVHLPG